MMDGWMDGWMDGIIGNCVGIQTFYVLHILFVAIFVSFAVFLG
jgi:hypothetical protein